MGMKKVVRDYEGVQIKSKDNRTKEKQYVKKLFQNENHLANGNQLSNNVILILKL